MVRPIDIHEIDEFSDIRSILDRAITDTIISNIKQLDEKQEMEPLIRQILYDPNETPHSPTEITDILTTHLHIRGVKQLAAFVLKGKSFETVRSRNVTYQFARLRQIPALDLMVLGAVGNIYDDAKRDFVQCAQDAGCDYLIIDCHDLSRLLIAYEKVCPKDGTPYDNTGICKNGHELDKGITLEMEVKEKGKYAITKQKDLSHVGAKRYAAFILLDRHYSKDIIRTVIQEVTEKLKHSNYYRNERVKARWGKTPAHVVWLYLACDLEDIRIANWVCRTCWIDSSLTSEMRPYPLEGNEKLGEIDILWNDDYKSHKDSYQSDFGTKEEVLNSVQSILNGMLKFARRAIGHFEDYRKGSISEQDFILKMQEMEPKAQKLYLESGGIPHPPPDCEDYYEACQNIFATIADMFLHYSESGLQTWSRENRDRLMQDSIEEFYDELKVIEIEERKIH